MSVQRISIVTAMAALMSYGRGRVACIFLFRIKWTSKQDFCDHLFLTRPKCGGVCVLSVALGTLPLPICLPGLYDPPCFAVTCFLTPPLAIPGSCVVVVVVVVVVSFILASALETRAHGESSTVVTDVLIQLNEDNFDLKLHVIDKSAGKTAVTVADAIMILQLIFGEASQPTRSNVCRKGASTPS